MLGLSRARLKMILRKRNHKQTKISGLSGAFFMVCFLDWIIWFVFSTGKNQHISTGMIKMC